MLNTLMKEDLNLNENLNEFLKEWEYHTNLRTLVENTSKLNEILEGEDSQATSVKANEMLVSEDMSDYIIKDLGSLDIKTDEN
ncbi:kinase-like domain-containing protein [Rhizophagus irregularis DAOM 181602=DAOM 197198]|nr:kinase-like domain-containing protein [Rhizophagus irregularis DAOM 181602=DAOM 197198]